MSLAKGYTLAKAALKSGMDCKMARRYRANEKLVERLLAAKQKLRLEKELRLLISSNLIFSQWDKIFKNAIATTAAAIDRLVHHSTIPLENISNER